MNAQSSRPLASLFWDMLRLGARVMRQSGANPARGLFFAPAALAPLLFILAKLIELFERRRREKSYTDNAESSGIRHALSVKLAPNPFPHLPEPQAM